MNSSIATRKQLSTPIKGTLRSESKSKLPVLSGSTPTSMQTQQQTTSVFGTPVEILQSKLIWPNLSSDKLYWVSDTKPPQNYASSFFFCIDNVIPTSSSLCRTSHTCRLTTISAR